jgi:hypothetical protein
VSLFRLLKYSSLLFLLGKYKHKVFRVVAVLLLAAVTALLYGDVEAYLAREHPETVIYALIGKILIVYGALAFVLWQFRPVPEVAVKLSANPGRPSGFTDGDPSGESETDRLSRLSDLDRHDQLKNRSSDLLSRRR